MSIYDEVKDYLYDSRGLPMSKALFFETNITKVYPSCFTLKGKDHTHNGQEYKSLKQIYLKIADPTEYSFAMEVFGEDGWSHWQKICSSPDLIDHIESWREELKVKLSSGAVKALINTAVTEGSKGTAAAKYLAERGWEKKPRTKAGKEKEKDIQSRITSSVTGDLERLGLH